MNEKGQAWHYYKQFSFIILYSAFIIFLASCSVSKQISRSANENVLKNKALQTAHVGISIYDPLDNKYLYNYQGDKYFVPASNTKIPTCYAAMKYLGDSLVGLKYGLSDGEDSSYTVLAIQPTGDPTFLHKDFKKQRVWHFLTQNASRFKERIALLDTIWEEERWGNGWSWNDYGSAYMAEKNVMPIFGNVIDLKLNEVKNRNIKDTLFPSLDKVNLLKTQYSRFDGWINANTYLMPPDQIEQDEPMFRIEREISGNTFWFRESSEKFSNRSIPFVTISSNEFWKSSHSTTLGIISDSLKYRFGSIRPREDDTSYTYLHPDSRSVRIIIKKWHKIHSQPTDSVLKPMMHRSDNF
ncbi:MAG: D-alanyl-D-alanine carboxypeptidase, partial [Chitinophagaceae bacterium]|nr:D-alanyl-D-alanine carboxypeptidase [Chitinophagaceae bacterium]